MNLAMTSASKYPPPGPDIDIPAFLRVDEAEAARRKQYWIDHPPRALASFGETDDRRQQMATMRAKLEAQAAEEKKERDKSAAARRAMEKEASKEGTFVSSKRMPGTEWSQELGRWVKPGTMSTRKFLRLLNQMPDAKHRQAFIDQFGEGQEIPPCEDTASASTRAATASTARAAASGKTRSPTAKSSSATKKAVSATTAPSTVTPPKSIAPATERKPRVPKEEQVAHIQAMLERPEGATLAEAGAKFGWLEHSTSAFISVNFRNKGKTTAKEKVEGRGTVYRLVK